MKERKEKEGAEREKGREEKFNALIKWRHQNPSSSRDTQSGHCVSFFFFFSSPLKDLIPHQKGGEREILK